MIELNIFILTKDFNQNELKQFYLSKVLKIQEDLTSLNAQKQRLYDMHMMYAAKYAADNTLSRDKRRAEDALEEMTDIEERNITPLRDKLNIYQNIIKGEEGTITKYPLNFSIDLQYFINLDPDYVVDLLKDMKVINQDLQSDKCDDGKREKHIILI